MSIELISGLPRALSTGHPTCMTSLMPTIAGALSPEAPAALAAAFAHDGKSIYLVGGIVRDWLLGRPSADYDFTTDALPEETKRILSKLSGSVFQPGEKYGTISAVIEGHVLQVTTFRGEQYAAGSRRPEVRYGVSLDEDLARRDFTMNAMALRLDPAAPLDPDDPERLASALIDRFAGRRDLQERVVRAVGDPAARFAEDPLRLLRAVRFSAQLGFNIEDKTNRAISAQANLMATVSRERILD
ncbi:MAG: CCA tRNA nucleotidyltransferase, partial [Chloroflexota bacterium]